MTRTLHATLGLQLSSPPITLGGLFALEGEVERPFPLRVVKVRTSITGNCCRTEVSQRFANPYEKALEATHIFPLPEDGAIIEMEMRAGTSVVKSVCLERKEAETKFNEAREQGHRAALLTQERADINTMQITNIPPLTDVWVKIVIVERLNPEDGRLVWRFPTVIAPRFIPGNEIGHDGQGSSPDTDAVPDASRISPPISLSGGARLDLEIRILGAVTTLATGFPAERVDSDGEVRLAPSSTATTDRDFVLSFTYAQSSGCKVSSFTDGKHTLVMVEPPTKATPESLPRDAVFVIDRSGSMEGAKLTAAKQALLTALGQLRSGDRFAIIAFSSSLDSFGAGLYDFTPHNLSRAQSWVRTIKADGGTEMFEAINHAWKGADTSDRIRTIVLITDAESGDEERLSSLVYHRPSTFQLFAIGIDSAVNTQLLKKLTRLGGGAAIFLSPDVGDLQPKITKFMESVGRPVMFDVEVENQAPARPGAQVIFAARSAAFLVEGPLDEVAVTGRTTDGSVRLTAQTIRIDFPLGSLWARERVSYLEDKLSGLPVDTSSAWLDDDDAHTPASAGGDTRTAILDEIRTTALEHKIASRCTAFVAVDETSQKQFDRIHVVQPVAMPALCAPSAGSGRQSFARLRTAPSASLGSVPFFASRSAPADHSMDYMELEMERSIDIDREDPSVKKWLQDSTEDGDTKLSVQKVLDYDGNVVTGPVVNLPREARNRHVVVVGRGDDGSQDGILLPLIHSDCINPSRSLVVVGLTPDLCEQMVALTRASCPQKEVIVFNPFDVGRGSAWNIFSALQDSADVKGFVQNFMEATSTSESAGIDIRLPQQGWTLLSELVTGLLEVPNESLTMGELVDVLNLNPEDLLQWLDDRPEVAKHLQRFMAMIKRGGNEANEILAHMRERLRPWAEDEVRKAMATNGISLERIVTVPALLIVEVPEGTPSQSPVVRLLAVEIIRHLMKCADESSEVELPSPIGLVFPDMVGTVGEIANLSFKMTSMRTRNISLVAGIPSIQAMTEYYGDDTKSLLEGFGCKIFGSALESQEAVWAGHEIHRVCGVKYSMSPEGWLESTSMDNEWRFLFHDGAILRACPASMPGIRKSSEGPASSEGGPLARIIRRAGALLKG